MFENILKKLGYVKENIVDTEIQMLRTRINELGSQLDKCIGSKNELNKELIVKNDEIKILEAKILYLETSLRKQKEANREFDQSALAALLIKGMDKSVEPKI